MAHGPRSPGGRPPDAPGFELVVLEGAVRPISMGTVKPFAEAALRRLTADKAFTSADGVVAGRGLWEATPEQAALKELMTAQPTEVFILADASKIGGDSNRPGCRSVRAERS